jgi:hypothetical protein
MWRLVLAISIASLAVSCEREPPADEEPDPEPVETATDTTQWIRAGETTAVKTPDRQACLLVPAKSFHAGFVEGDSARITIQRLSPTQESLPAELPTAFRAAQASGHLVFPPLYQFAAYDGADQEFSEFADSITVALCAAYRPGEAEAFQGALLARPHPDNPDSLQFFTWREPPAECDLGCEPRGSEASAQEAAVPLGRWLTGSPVSATPAQAAQTQIRGIGSGGSGKSAFAAVDTVARNAMQAQ